MSFHGIPERYEREGDPYGHQCRRTAALLAEALGLAPEQWTASFQSRFGKEEWLKPYTDLTVGELPLAASSGSMSSARPSRRIASRPWRRSRCRTGEIFMAAGGEQFEYIPALNSDQAHIRMMVSLICRELA